MALVTLAPDVLAPPAQHLGTETCPVGPCLPSTWKALPHSESQWVLRGQRAQSDPPRFYNLNLWLLDLSLNALTTPPRKLFP